MQAIDIGCGGGLLSEPFAAMGCEVTGIDQSLPTLEAASRHAQASGLSIDYRQGDAGALPFADHSFDVVCCSDVLEHVDSPAAVIGEIARVLKPGGVFFKTDATSRCNECGQMNATSFDSRRMQPGWAKPSALQGTTPAASQCVHPPHHGSEGNRHRFPWAGWRASQGENR